MLTGYLWIFGDGKYILQNEKILPITILKRNFFRFILNAETSFGAMILLIYGRKVIRLNCKEYFEFLTHLHQEANGGDGSGARGMWKRNPGFAELTMSFFMH